MVGDMILQWGFVKKFICEKAIEGPGPPPNPILSIL